MWSGTAQHLNVVGSVTGPLIEEESFWERCCKARWDLCDVSCYNNCWKKMYFERHLEETLEKFVPPDFSSSMHGDSMKEVRKLIQEIQCSCNIFADSGLVGFV